ncbi:hypothetical protein PGT21_017797 [Puccinia graminis f. sp. tritici]|uniref:Uncharacterized protein n=1 Tax=Puccinia graminis f. sp. tritici TaxID=56615 RepID=A0A5B0NMQ7_PUCGR|nr:hypothetical protein PGT21_017797 [Puccinia graminis f. sp. tritici]
MPQKNGLLKKAEQQIELEGLLTGNHYAYQLLTMSGQINMSTPAKTYITSRHRLRIHPLPPPIVGHLTGLTCPECPLNSTSQLRYHPPRFANPANINWQPDSNHRDGKGYIRTLNVEHLINNIRAVNEGARPPPPPGSLSGLLNSTNEAPDHMKVKSTGKLCPGYLGKTGATHHSSIKSNMKCSHKLCLSCCQMGQRVHYLTCNFKGHLYTPSSSGDSSGSTPVIRRFVPSSQQSGLILGPSEQLQLPQPSGLNASSHKQIQSAQANRTVTSTLTPSQLLEYHQNLQAVDLLAKSREAAKSMAPGSSTMINAEAPHWPLFSLQESQILLDRCRKALDNIDGWESEIEVWNMEQFQWISLAPTCHLTYPLRPRKLLVRLEHVAEHDCAGLQDAILKMTTKGPYEPLTTPARCILAKIPSLPNSNSGLSSSSSTAVQQLTYCPKSGMTEPKTYQANIESPKSSPLPLPSKLYSTTSDIEWIGSSSQETGGPDAQLENGRASSKWPDSRVLLRQTLRWHVSSQSEGNPRDSWDKCFGDIYDYGHTTVYRVRKWILLVGKEKLELHLQDDPSLTLIAARQMYFKEWKDTKNTGGKDQNRLNQKRKAQGVELDKQQKRKLDHGQGLLDVQSTEDSDVEIVRN